MRLSRERSTDWRMVLLIAVLLLLLALGVGYVNHGLVPSLGIVVVAASLLLPPRGTLTVALVAIVLAVVVIVTDDIEVPLVRLANVLLACTLAVLASTFLDRRYRRVQQLLRQQQEVLAAVPEAVVLLDVEGVLQQGNAGQARLFPDAVVGQRLHPAVGHVLADGRPCPGGCALDGHPPDGPGNVPVEGERITLAGRSVPIAYTSGRLDDSGMVVTVRDVSVRIQAEADRRVLLEAAARQAEQEHLLAEMGSPRFVAPPALPGLTLDLWSTSDSVSLTGADLVTTTALPDGRVLLLMVDATGSGVAAVRDAWKVMYTCRAHMSAGAPLAEMIAQCSASLAGDGEAPDASVLGISLDPQTGHLQVASGGHPPPLLVRRNGAARWVEATGRGLGQQTVPGSQSLAEGTLDAGDSMVLYTDGVVDGASDVIAGLGTLRSIAIALRAQPTEGLARRLVESVRLPGAVGDATLLVARLAPAS